MCLDARVYNTLTKASVADCNAECSGDGACGSSHFYPSDGTCELHNISGDTEFEIGENDVIGAFKCGQAPMDAEKIIRRHPVSFWPLDEEANALGACAAPQDCD